MNFTGQKLDGTGLDPSVSRFVLPDRIVPGASSGVGGAGGCGRAPTGERIEVQ
jgi:hypothetical protein